MTVPPNPEPTDFAPPADDLVFTAEDSGPVVGRVGGGANPIAVVGGFGALAILLFVVLNGRREERVASLSAPAQTSASAADWSPPPLELPVTQISAQGPSPFSGLPTQAMPAPMQAQPVTPAPSAPAFPANGDAGPFSATRLRAPSVVVDLGGAPRETVLAQAGAAAPGGIGAAVSAPVGAAAQRPQLNDSEQFAKRVGEEEPDRARATPMRNLRTVAPQGTIIPGVLETAINSDLPGFTRAIVSRDVLSFDGRAVLIPRSSRLIGQYKSAVALGQSRAFIIWTRVIRPDGVSIQIASPGTDELGRGGLTGEVDSHFFRRFSGSILLSVLNAAVSSVSRTPSTQISIGSPGAAAGIAGAAVQGDSIPPTIKVAQGEAINIFVARDLDFSGAEPVK